MKFDLKDFVYLSLILVLICGMLYKPALTFYIKASRKHKYFVLVEVSKTHVELELRRRKMDSLKIGGAVVRSVKRQGLPLDELSTVLKRGNAEIDLDAANIRTCLTNVNVLPSFLFYFTRNDLTQTDSRVLLVT